MQRGSIQLSHTRLLLSRAHSSSSNLPSPTEAIVTNTHNLSSSPQNRENTTQSQFKHALNNIPTRILYQLLRKNRIKVSATQNQPSSHSTNKHPSKQLLLSKLYRLTSSKHSNANSRKSRVHVDNFSVFSSELVRKSCLKLRDFNKYYNDNHHVITELHPFQLSLSLLIEKLENLNSNMHEIQTSSINPSVSHHPASLHNLDELKRDFLYELLPSIHTSTEHGNKTEEDMVKLCELFIRFSNFPRLTMFDHVQYISHLCLINDILDNFLSRRVQSVHPSRTNVDSKNNGNVHHNHYYHYNPYKHHHDEDEDDMYDEYDAEYDDEEDEHVDGHDDDVDDRHGRYPIDIRDEDGNSIPYQIESIKQLNNRFSKNTKTDEHKKKSPNATNKQSLPMDEKKLNELYLQRLKHIHKMDLTVYGVYGLDECVKTQLKRALLSRGLHPSFITAPIDIPTKTDESDHSTSDNSDKSESDNKHRSLCIDHNKGILLHGPPGTGKTLLAKCFSKLLLTNEENVSIVNGPEIEDVYIGQTEKNIRNLFEKAKQDDKQYGMHSPLHVIIFDEMDSIAKKRDSSSHSKVYDRSVQQLLSCLDGINSMNNILVIGTTNRYQDIDNALLRPGRFGQHIYIGLPDEKQRRELLTQNKNVEMFLDENNIDLTWLINLTEGLSHSDIISLITQSKINAIERLIDEYMKEGEGEQKKEEEEALRRCWLRCASVSRRCVWVCWGRCLRSNTW
mmetsp:Transcript_56237/g.89533  ORF Transcript_56237/g.89533 Transcript_56237/m.89533 type:complete len:732 (-) Transcript_56237:244-2439(-)